MRIKARRCPWRRSANRDARAVNADLGFTGEPVSTDVTLLETLAGGDAGFIPVISPISADEAGDGYNINADTAAGTHSMIRIFGLLLLHLGWANLAMAQADPTPETVTPSTNTSEATATLNWDVCNETSYNIRFASAFIRDDRMQTVGWTNIQPGACTTLVTPKDSPRFLYAESLPIHQGGVREWKGPIQLCATEKDFTSDATENCALKNLEIRDFFAVKPTERQTAFIEPGDFGINAEIAGLQRLLQDSGYKITRVDGLSGRRTLRTIARAKSDLKLDKSASNQELITALIPKAEEARNSIGLDICNDGTNRMFTAIAIQQDGNWTSRGWWPIDIGQCVKPLDRSLIGTQAHIYALQEDSTLRQAHVER